MTLPLFDAFPRLRDTVPHVAFAALPTPVERLECLGARLGTGELWIKRDDLSGEYYGGNKVRKLEFLLADARDRGAREVITFGVAGSNHTLATAIYARELGMRGIAVVTPQTNASYVARNLRMGLHVGAEIRHCGNQPQAERTARWRQLRGLLLSGRCPYLIRMGGSSPLGAVGFVNAAFELKLQLRQAGLVEPQRIYVALGTMGTAAGLALGLKAAGLGSRLVAVRVVDSRIGNEEKFGQLYGQTSRLLHQADPAFPDLELEEGEVEFRHEFFGEKYALFTPEGVAAIRLLREQEGIPLEGTYTGKAMAALLADASRPELREQRLMFWNTYNSRPFPEAALELDYHLLPSDLHGYFERPVQPLDPSRSANAQATPAER